MSDPAPFGDHELDMMRHIASDFLPAGSAARIVTERAVTEIERLRGALVQAREAISWRRQYPGKDWYQHPRLTGAWRSSEDRMDAALAAIDAALGEER